MRLFTRTMIIKEHIDFQRGLDPKKAMGIGFFRFDVEYSGGFEENFQEDELFAREWIYDGGRILEAEGSAGSDHISMWIKLSDGKEFSVETNFREKSAYLTIPAEDIKDKNVSKEFFEFFYNEDSNPNYSPLNPVLSIYESYFKEIEDEKEMQREWEEANAEELDESQNFERGMDPKDSMGIGNELYRENLQTLGFVKNAFSWIEDNAEVYASRLTDLGVKLSSINQKTSDLFVFNWLNPRGAQQIRTINLPKENWVNLFAAVTGFIRDVEVIKEAMNFERGRDPKKTMKIGTPSWNTLEEGDIIQCRKRCYINKDSKISIKGEAYIEKATFIKVTDFDNASTKEWVLYFFFYEGREIISYHIMGTPKQFQHYFKILPRNMSESQGFQRGKDPKISMNIGQRALIEKWLKKYDLFEDAEIADNLTINIPAKSNLVVDLSRKDIEELPKYIQFGIVYGGFNIGNNKLISLRGCPKKVLETEKLKGNFKCGMNQLISLEYAPKVVDGNFLCNSNPGQFKRSDVTKVCKVKSGKIWADAPTRYIMPVKEAMDFQRSELPLDTLNIGLHSKIVHWMKATMHIIINEDEDYRINKDGTIDLLKDFNMVRVMESDQNELPDFIRFNIAYGGFYAANNYFTSLEGFPKEVYGDFSIYGGPRKWKENEIRKYIKINGTIWN